MKVLDGKVAIVTGAGTGLGRGIAQELAEAGASIAVLEIDGETGRVAAEELAGTGVESRAYETDVAESTQVDDAFASVARDFGRLDIVVNNAGISRGRPSHTGRHRRGLARLRRSHAERGLLLHARGRQMHDPAEDRLGHQHLVDPGLLSEPGPDHLLRPQGRGDHDDEGRGGRMGAARRPCQRDRAGRASDSMWDADVARGAIDEQFYIDTVPVHRLGLPSEVGKLVVFLSSDDAAYITGSIHTIDGALTAIPAG